MLSAKVLNSDATLNDYKILDVLNFIPGEQVKLFVQIFDLDHQIRFIPPEDAIVTFCFINNDGSMLDKVSPDDITILEDDRSLMYMTIEEAESLELSGGNVTFKIDLDGDGTRIVRGMIQNGLAKYITGGC